ncbi:glycosyltransferase family 9 protein [Bordetella sp. H567]|uniref:glycosyltransferase family 9 protein n=1 Tax=Bordetella sp. H567 TaxID=1697043 RepID=UPI001F4239AB|nr:glycosyltransferase family 9 protein [Bordetella sp. H567]
MNIANNLRRAGRRVVVFGTHGYALANWFPGFDIRPLPGEDEIAALGDYAAIIQMAASGPIAGLDERFAQFRAIKSRPAPKAPMDSGGRGSPSWSDGAPGHAHRYNGAMASFRAFTLSLFGLSDWTREIGLQAPAHLRPRLHERRVIIHPTSSEAARCWKPSQYVALATVLRTRGFEPVFVLAPAERAEWRDLLARHGLSILDAPDLAHTAEAIYESGWFIGTDSGIGHLASACGIPTVTIVDRPRNMRRWRPVWAPGLVVQPWWLPMRWLRRAYWREATTVGRTLRTFDKLRKWVEDDGRAAAEAAGNSRPLPR